MIIPDFDENLHEYRVNGRKIKSVTQILSSIGVKNGNGYWNSLTGSEFIIDKTAANFGTAFHAVVECQLKGILCEYDMALEPWIRGLEKFRRYHSRLISYMISSKPAVEIPLYSSKYNYCGTFDWLAESTKDGSLYLIDWKTSTICQEYWKWQTAAYVELIKGNFNIKKGISTISVRIFENDYQMVMRKPNEVRIDFNKFLSVLNIINMTE